MQPARLLFKPIDLAAHAELCVAFRRDSFICSFGVDDFFDRAGPKGEQYIERLELRMAKFPTGYVHVWYEANIVGQMEMQVLEDPRIGYVNLFYLVEGMRGCGLSHELQGYAMQFCSGYGVRTAQLSVSPTNARALAYYRKHKWRDLGPRPGHDKVHLMECDVPPDMGTRR